MTDPVPEESALERLRRLERGDAEGRRVEIAASGRPAGRGGASKGRGWLAGIVAALLLAVAKGKALLLLLFTKGGLLLSALKLGKLATTLGTMGVSFAFYVGLYTWKFALGILVLILVHECGHGIAAMRLGLRVGAPIFIPGFGAVIALKDQPRSTWVSAVVGYGGPLAGTLGGLVVLIAGRLGLDSDEGGLANALAHFTFLINFFNLLPVGGLDGDRITEPLTVSQWWAGLGATAVVTVLSIGGLETREGRTDPQVVFAIAILALGVWKAIRVHRRAARAAAGTGRLLDRVVGQAARYTEESSVTPRRRLTAAIAYFGLVAVLSWLAILSEPPPR